MDRTLTHDQEAAYRKKFAALDLIFKVEDAGGEPFGFTVLRERVAGKDKKGDDVILEHGVRFDYRYQEGQSATELLDLILTEQGG
jgi:hypothetical protein